MKKHFISLTLAMGFLVTSCTTTEIPIDEQTQVIEEVITYNADVKTIIDNNCTGCHGTVSPQAGLSLVTYQQVRTAAEIGNLIQRMNSATNPMPPSGRLSADIRAIIDAWADDGFLEN